MRSATSAGESCAVPSMPNEPARTPAGASAPAARSGVVAISIDPTPNHPGTPSTCLVAVESDGILRDAAHRARAVRLEHQARRVRGGSTGLEQRTLVDARRRRARRARPGDRRRSTPTIPAPMTTVCARSRMLTRSRCFASPRMFSPTVAGASSQLRCPQQDETPERERAARILSRPPTRSRGRDAPTLPEASPRRRRGWRRSTPERPPADRSSPGSRAPPGSGPPPSTGSSERNSNAAGSFSWSWALIAL